MKYTLVADTHLFSKYEVPNIRQRVLDLPANENTILLGDIVDLSCCDKNSLQNANRVHEYLEEKHGTNYLDGNHDPEYPIGTFKILNSIYITHGDLEANPEKWPQYRKKHLKKQGAGWLKKLFIMNTVSLFNELIGGRPKIEFFQRAAKRAKANNCHTYICGHLHPKKLIDVNYDGIRIVVVPQGITEIEL